MAHLEAADREQAEHTQKLLEAVRDRCYRTGVRLFARQANVDEANLAHVLSGRRKPSGVMLAKLETALAQDPSHP